MSPTKLKHPNKFLLFLWIIIHNALSRFVKAELQKGQACYVFCGIGEETAGSSFSVITRVREVWFDSNCALKYDLLQPQLIGFWLDQ